jgi:hypothetical protein
MLDFEKLLLWFPIFKFNYILKISKKVIRNLLRFVLQGFRFVLWEFSVFTPSIYFINFNISP